MMVVVVVVVGGGAVIKHKTCVLFYLELLSETPHFKKCSARSHHKYTQVFMQSSCYAYQTSTKHEFSRQIFEKILTYQI